MALGYALQEQRRHRGVGQALHQEGKPSLQQQEAMNTIIIHFFDVSSGCLKHYPDRNPVTETDTSV